MFLTSTFAFESAAAGSGISGDHRQRPGGADGLSIRASTGQIRRFLEARLGVWEKAEDALVFSSGMSAIRDALLAHVSMNDVIVHSGAALCRDRDADRAHPVALWRDLCRFPAEASREEMDAILVRAKQMAADQGGKVAMVYLESPANPTNALVDVETMRAATDAAFAADARPPIAIDNTFLGPCGRSRWRMAPTSSSTA